MPAQQLPSAPRLGSEARPWQSAASPSSNDSQASGVSEACSHAGSVSSAGLRAQVTSLLVDAPFLSDASDIWSLVTRTEVYTVMLVKW